MHEAGLAESIVASIRHAKLDGSVIRVVVSGGHEHGQASRDALAAHIEARLPGVGATVEVLEGPGSRLCSMCTLPFAQVNDGDTCPACGGLPLPPALDEEEVSVEVIEPIRPGDR